MTEPSDSNLSRVAAALLAHLPDRNLFAALLCLLPISSLNASVPEPSTADFHELRVLSYNIQDLPGLVGTLFGRREAHYQRMGELLAQRRRAGTHPQVVFLQEAYTERSLELVKRAGYPFIYRGPNESRKWVSSGLIVLSDFPAAEDDRHAVAFADYGDNCAEWECLVNKSAMLLAVQLPQAPEKLLLATTHLQAQTRNDAARVRQVNVLLAEMQRRGLNRFTSIFAADFNFKPNRHGSYDHFVAHSGFEDVGGFCLQRQNLCRVDVGDKSNNGVDKTDLNDVYSNTNDRHFIRQPSGSAVRVMPTYLTRNFVEELNGDDLSDHYGYEVHYRVSWD
jgi:hypothetical protein